MLLFFYLTFLSIVSYCYCNSVSSLILACTAYRFSTLTRTKYRRAESKRENNHEANRIATSTFHYEKNKNTTWTMANMAVTKKKNLCRLKDFSLWKHWTHTKQSWGQYFFNHVYCTWEMSHDLLCYGLLMWLVMQICACLKCGFQEVLCDLSCLRNYACPLGAFIYVCAHVRNLANVLSCLLCFSFFNILLCVK